MFTEEFKEFANRVIPTKGMAYDYQYFPSLEHSFATKGDLNNEAEKRGLKCAKDAAISWFLEWLHVQ